ncbi:Kri1 protein [Saccharomycopsis crataegensis]|uniref:Kri1 protein n=1 Tax=Saccharomycopsis crataegensis TaxID=43959 RepID=A0AAV5QUV8_9ASCO|nr:Kri1 protein [Saccharomycopsis crataegensis]
MPRKKSASKRAKEAQDKEISNENAPEETKTRIEEPEPSDDESSSSEEEDEYGDLLDNETDNQINRVLDALKSNDSSLKNKDVKFFDEPEEAVKKLEKSGTAEKNRPMYLHDYHRINLLNGGGLADDDEEQNDEGLKTYAEQQKEDKDQLLSEIKNAFGDDGGNENNSNGDDDDDDDDDDDFLKKKERKREPIVEAQLPNPEEDQEKFLSEFLNQHAWIPRSKNDTENLDLGTEDQDALRAEEEFDDAVENFERVYNFRYEDSTSAEIISYARSQATMRRSKMNSRKKQRVKKQEKIKEKKEKHEQNLKKKKQDKINKVMDRLAEIKKAVGEDVDTELVQKVFGESLLNDDFDDGEWDNKMNQIFDEKYYNAEEKPQWDDDDEIMQEFYDEKKNKNDDDDDDQEDEEAEAEETQANTEEQQDEAEEVEEDAPPKKKSKKEKLAEKKSAKKSKESLKKQAEQIVQSNIMKVEEEVDDEESKENDDGPKFKYIQVEPETFGLTQKEILLADDKDLNEFIGLKKLAPYRDPNHVAKDRRKVSKKRRLRDWRKQVFDNEEGLQ